MGWNFDTATSVTPEGMVVCNSVIWLFIDILCLVCLANLGIIFYICFFERKTILIKPYNNEQKSFTNRNYVVIGLG